MKNIFSIKDEDEETLSNYQELEFINFLQLFSTEKGIFTIYFLILIRLINCVIF